MLGPLPYRTGKVEGATVVLDRGMASGENLIAVKALGLHYMVAARHEERYPRVAGYYDISYSEASGLIWREEKAKKEIAEKLDGGYALKTDRSDLSADKTWRIYSLLTRAEAAFEAMKSPLAERPIFHRLQERVQTHIFLCILAYHLLVSIERRCEKGRSPSTQG